MDGLITHVIAWPTVLASLLLFGFAPGAMLRVIVLAWPRDHPRRRELLGELPNVEFFWRPVWVCSQLENALFEGLAERLASAASRRSALGEAQEKDAVSRYLEILEGSVAALRDFERGKKNRQAIPYRLVSSASARRLPGSVYRMTVHGPAILTPGALVELDGHPRLHGIVKAVMQHDVQVLFDAPTGQYSLPAQGSLRLRHDDRLYHGQRQAIARLREGDAVNPQLISALASRVFLPFTPDRSVSPGARLDLHQSEAVSNACAVRDFLLVTSPPGTGRTTVASEIVDLCARRGERVLVVGATSTGVDSLLSRLPADMAKVRVTETDSVPAFPLDPAMLNFVVSDPGGAAGAPPCSAYDEAHVVAGTAAGITMSGITTSQVFDLLVIVEAEQVSLPAAIVSLVSARRVVLIGDPLQLPLFVDPEMHDWLRFITASDGQDQSAAGMRAMLTTSLFELLVAEAPSTHKFVLTSQYRMPSAVADFVSRKFYNGILSTPAAARYPEFPASPLIPQPFTIVDTSCLSPWERRDRRARNGYVNRAESDVISAIVAAEDGRGRDWAVMVPYADQASLIREQLQGRLGSARSPEELVLRVGTIDSFAGREHDLVLVGCTRSNGSRSVGFLHEMRRFNVALTRARRQLVVVGDMETLRNARDTPVRELMNTMFNYVEHRGEVVRADTITWRLRQR